MKNKNIILQFLTACIIVSSAHIACAQSYTITYKNNTSQTLTTSICVAHNDRFSLFKTGRKASEGLKILAEDGDESSLVRELKKNRAVRNISTGAFISSKQTGRVIINSKKAPNVSCVFGMLTATNDAFVGINTLKLSKNKRSLTFKATTYDAGTEMNTELCEHVPGGPRNSHFVGIRENGSILPHPGILGVGDLNQAEHGWSEPAVEGQIN